MRSFSQYMESDRTDFMPLIEAMHQLGYDPQDFAQEFFERAIAEEDDPHVKQEIGDLYVEFMQGLGQALRTGWDAVKGAGQRFMQGWRGANYQGFPKEYQPIMAQMDALHKAVQGSPLAQTLAPIFQQMAQAVVQAGGQQQQAAPAGQQPGVQAGQAGQQQAVPAGAPAGYANWSPQNQQQWQAAQKGGGTKPSGFENWTPQNQQQWQATHKEWLRTLLGEPGMKTFDEWLENQKVLSLADEIASLMVELEIEPAEYLIKHYEKQPLSEGLFGNIMRGLGRLGGTMGQSLGTAARQVGQSAMAGAGAMRDAIAGPEARYNNALQALQALAQELTQNQMLQGNMQSSQATAKLVADLQGILKQLQQQQATVKQLLQVSATPAQSQGAQLQMGAGGAAAPAGAGSAVPMPPTGTGP